MDSNQSQQNKKTNILLQIITDILQVNTNKPLSVKVFQWFFLFIPVYYFLNFSGILSVFWWFDLLLLCSLLAIFFCLYAYNRWSLYVLRIIGIIPIFPILFLSLFMIINFGLALVGINITEINIPSFVIELERIAKNPYGIVSVFLGLSLGIMLYMTPMIIIYAYLWSQADRYRYLQLKEKTTKP